MRRTIDLPNAGTITLADLYLLLGTSRVVAFHIPGLPHPRGYEAHPYRVEFVVEPTRASLAFLYAQGSYHTWVDMISAIEVEDE